MRTAGVRPVLSLVPFLHSVPRAGIRPKMGGKCPQIVQKQGESAPNRPKTRGEPPDRAWRVRPRAIRKPSESVRTDHGDFDFRPKNRPILAFFSGAPRARGEATSPYISRNGDSAGVNPPKSARNGGTASPAQKSCGHVRTDRGAIYFGRETARKSRLPTAPSSHSHLRNAHRDRKWPDGGEAAGQRA
jgi:hypothetical protein